MDHESDEPESWDVPPWELPGNCRLDAEPHRGALLRRLANAGFVCAVVSYYPAVCVLVACLVHDRLVFLLLFVPAIVLALFASGVGLTVRALAGRDLAGMRAGLIDAGGYWETEFGQRRAAVSAALGLVSVLLWGGSSLLQWLSACAF